MKNLISCTYKIVKYSKQFEQWTLGSYTAGLDEFVPLPSYDNHNGCYKLAQTTKTT